MLVQAAFGYVHPSVPKRTGPDRRNRLDPAFQKYFNTVLRPSVRKHGVKQAIICHSDGNGGEVLVDGRSRDDAALLEGIAQIPRLLYPNPLSQQEADIAAYAANAQRCEFTFRENASFMVETMAATGWSKSQLSRELQIDKSDVTRHVQPFERLPPELLDKAGSGDGKLPARALYCLSQVEDSQTVMALAEKVMKGLYTCEALEDEVRALKGGKKAKEAKPQIIRDSGVVAQFPSGWTDGQITEWMQAWLKKLRSK